MATGGTCKQVGCEKPAIERAYFCGVHISAKHRCRRYAGDDDPRDQCKRAALKGSIWCKTHAGNMGKAISERAVVLTAMQKFTKPYEGDLDAMAAFEMEYRRTLGRIAWYDGQLALLPTEQDLVWGLTKKEVINAGDFPGTNKTYEAKANMFLELQNWERKHLLEMSKVWISAGLEVKKLALMRDYVDAAYMGVLRALTALGIDATDPKVQRALEVALVGEEAAQSDILSIEQMGKVEA